MKDALNELKDALNYYQKAIEAVEQLRGHMMIEFRAGFLEDKESIYEDAVVLCLQGNLPLQGLSYAERAKSRSFLNLVAYRLDLGVQIRDETDRPLVEELTRLQSERDQLYYRCLESNLEDNIRGWTPPVNQSDIDARQVEQDIHSLKKQITNLWHRLLIRNADYARDAALW